MLVVKELNVYRGNSHIIKNCSLEVKEGEVVHLQGQNGSGKSTLLEAIAGLIPSRGEIKFESINICNPEDFLYDELTVKENLELFLGNAFSLSFGIDKLLDRRIGTLSRGEKTRVSLVRAIQSQPSVLLFDEVLSPLDTEYRKEFLGFINTFSGAIVVTSHEEISNARPFSLGTIQ